MKTKRATKKQKISENNYWAKMALKREKSLTCKKALSHRKVFAEGYREMSGELLKITKEFERIQEN